MFDNYDQESVNEERHKSIAQSIRTVDVDELKKLGDEIFRQVDDPWREIFLQFIAENPGATFHYATTSDGVHVIYCSDKNKGMWFLPGTGKGPLQARGCQAMKDIIDKGH